MKVELVEIGGGLTAIDRGIGKCWDMGDYCDPVKRDKRINRVALQHRHGSVLEFCTFTYDITASTKVLLEQTRSRIASYACKSTRYCLSKDLKNVEAPFHKPVLKDFDYVEQYDFTAANQFIELTDNEDVNKALVEALENTRKLVRKGISNELTSLTLTQAWKYDWVCMFNARSLKNFFELRRAHTAHFQIREVANAMFDALPEEYKFLFEDTEKAVENDN